MRHLSIALALSTLLLIPICSAAQLPPVNGFGTTGMIPIWTGGTHDRQNIGDSLLGITNNPQVVVSSAPVDVEPGQNAEAWYEIYGNTVLSIGSEVSDHNVFLGVNAGSNNVPGMGVRNNCVGHGSCNANTTGTDNTFFGDGSGNANTAGSFNTYVGSAAGINNVGSSNIYLGYGAGQFQSSESNTIRMGGNSQINATYIAGVYTTTLASGNQVFVDDSGRLGTMSSSRRFKEQIRDMGDSTNALMNLRPITFFYKPEYATGQHTLQYGLIAEEVAKVYPELVAYDNDGKPYAVRYQYIATMLLNEVQKQYHRGEAEAEQIKAQQQEIDSLKQQLQVQNAALQERLSRLEALARVETAAAH